MLQIKRIFFLIVCFTSYNFAYNSPKNENIDWILENALEEEFIYLDTTGIITPSDFKTAVTYYKNGKYRQASAILEDLLKLQLPDGQLDFISFMIGECYRKLYMKDNAKKAYQYVIDNFPYSDKLPAAYFRLLQFAYEEKQSSLIDTLIILFTKEYKIHPLYNSVLYVGGKLYFHTARYGEAVDILLKIPEHSSRHFQGQFVAALSLIMLKNIEKALLILNYIRKNCTDNELIADVNVLLGDIFFNREKYQIALPYYRIVSKEHEKFQYAQVKIANIFLKLKQYQKARNIAKSFLSKGRKSGYFFEMASILEQIYNKTEDKTKNERIKKLIQKQNINAHISFEVNEELVKVYELIRKWKIIEYNGMLENNKNLYQYAQNNVKQLEKLKKKFRVLLYDIGAIEQDDISKEVPGLVQQRYITLLRNKISEIEDTISIVKNKLKFLSDFPKDSIVLQKTLKHESFLNNSKKELALHKNEYEVLKKEFLESGNNAEKFGTVIQAKYVDWSFMRYLEKKSLLEKVNEKLSQLARKSPGITKHDTSSLKASTNLKKTTKKRTEDISTTKNILAIKRDKLIHSIADDRIRLKEHIEMFLEASPGSSYNPQILFRLSELHYDKATEDFNFRLDEYERLRDEINDSVEIEFPKYNLEDVIMVYNKIINQYPKNWLADDALFYKAHALKKLGLDKRANLEFQELIKKYPESEYYVEANMNIGSYFFNNSNIDNNSGYKLAEEAYRRVLSYREHPQFVHAIYHLGWCYYMQDQYDDAISVFKYLVEEVDLDFNITQTGNTQVLNPLMREEAIDYIAISFDERNDLDGAVNFLSLIGNIDYAAHVFKRIGELREEDLDYDAAINVYKRLIDEYALSSIAPDAAENLIKVYESNNRHKEAMFERELFFKRYARGSKWHVNMLKKDSQRVSVVDSMTIAIGLYVADGLYRKAEKNGQRDDYIRAMDNYKRLVDNYPDEPTTAEAFWNLAIILDLKLNEKEKAFKTYISYSRFKRAENDRREQAALNAIALAQRMDTSDTTIDSTGINNNTLRIIHAAENYLMLFPYGKSFTKVVMNMGSVYFNRKLYSDAISTYKIITKRGKIEPEYFNAGFLISKCFFSEGKWQIAGRGFEKIWKESPDEFQRQEAYKLLLQSKFLYAKGLFDSGKFEKSAIEYRNIDRKYPGSEYGDITLFNSAEAFEKHGDIVQSCKTYFELYQKYPLSKLAPGALFNAASNYEKIERFNKSAEMYEHIIETYPKSKKAKDALFNVGFSYEKLGKFDKMAEANERYAKMFPGEKDVELLLFRTAEFYYNSSKFEKSITLYKNYITRYSKSDRTVEAYYKIGKCYYKNNDLINATMSFNQAEGQNKRFLQTGLKGDNYFAAEAAFSLAKIKQNECSAIQFDVPAKDLKKQQQAKTKLLASAVKAYQRVMKYKSEKMFEASYRIGEMYEEFAYSWNRQKLKNKDPIKLAIAKKDIEFASASLMKKTFTPYKKVIELASNLDIIIYEQQQWIDSASIKLSRNCSTIGNFMINGITAMQKSPIPNQIKENLLYLFQYRKQLLETLELLKIETRDFFLTAYKELLSQGIIDENTEECINKFGQINFLIPNEYEKLAEEILTSSNNIPKNLDEDEKEELIFQFEDIIFELQDKALFGYEDAQTLAIKENQTDTKWYNKILERLARLNPDIYGKNFYQTKTFETDSRWIAHSDSVRYWNAPDPFAGGWQQVDIVSTMTTPNFKVGNPQVIWGNYDSDQIFLWKNAFLNGLPIRGKIYFACSGKYRLYLNEKLLVSDTTNNKSFSDIDSITSIEKILKGGDNILAIEITNSDSLKRGVALVLHTLIDTSEHFKTTAMKPKIKKIFRPKRVVKKEQIQTKTLKPMSSTTPSESYVNLFRNKGELYQAIEKFQKKTHAVESLIRKERIEVQKLNIKIDAINGRISNVLEEIENLKKLKSEMSREK